MGEPIRTEWPRPDTIQKPDKIPYSVQLPIEIAAEVDRMAATACTSRSQILRELVLYGLRHATSANTRNTVNNVVVFDDEKEH